MIYTGYFAKMAAYRNAGLTPVSIARYAPKWYTGHQYKQLAPLPEMLRMSEPEYVPLYNTSVLRYHNPARLAEELHTLGDNVVLLCYEKPEDFCHRHLVAKWLQHYRVPCEEYQLNRVPDPTPASTTLSLF